VRIALFLKHFKCFLKKFYFFENFVPDFPEKYKKGYVYHVPRPTEKLIAKRNIQK
jgi:hypothetical protein